MTTYSYSFKEYNKEKMTRIVGRDLPISTKQSVEICSFIKGKNLQKAKEMLADVIKMKIAIPFKRFTEGAGHKKGNIAGGRYPVKASEEILKLLNSLEANAQQKGLDTSGLVIKHLCANKASRPPKYGRIRGRLAKRSHVEIVALEAEKKTEKPEEKKAGKEKKVEEKKAEEKKEVKAEPKKETETKAEKKIKEQKKGQKKESNIQKTEGRKQETGK